MAGKTEAPRSGAVGWLPFFILPPAALAIGRRVPAWLWMWTIAFSIFASFKWLTWWRALASGAPRDWKRSLAYLLLWPGMDAESFLGTSSPPARPASAAWATAALMTVAGAALFYCVAPAAEARLALAGGWLAMVGLVMALHFGSFHLLALAWQSVGIHAARLMNAPLLSTSPSDFWGRRWNLAFHQLSRELLFGTLRPRLGAPGAALGVFVASGLVHELVISLPARGGWGLPTAYFTLQGLAVFLERSRVGRRWGLDRGVRGRVFAFVAIGAPAFFLFHPPFVRNVVLPMMRALGAR